MPIFKKHVSKYDSESRHNHKRRRIQNDIDQSATSSNYAESSNASRFSKNLKWHNPNHTSKNWSQSYDDFSSNREYIRFLPSSDDEELDDPHWAREWDKGKWVSSDGTYRSSKRKVFQSDRDSDRNDHDRYTSRRNRADLVSKKAPWTTELEWSRYTNVADMYVLYLSQFSSKKLTLTQRLHDEVEAFVQYISPTSIEHEVRSMLVKIIRRSIEDAFPDATVHTFGSFETKLYLPQG